MSAELGLIEKQLTELLTKNFEKLKFPTGLKVIQDSIRKYFDNYQQRKEMIERSKGGYY